MGRYVANVRNEAHRPRCNCYGKLGTDVPHYGTNVPHYERPPLRMALLGDGTVRAWGDNGYGQLGDGTTDDRPLPGQVPGLGDVGALSAGYAHSLALKENGTVWAWGANANGQLGDGATEDRQSPVRTVDAENVASLATKWHHSVALMDDGTIWTWGDDSYGQLAHGKKQPEAAPSHVPGIVGVTAVAGSVPSFALKNDSSLWA